MKNTFLNWSSGKDAAYALNLLQQKKEFSVQKLVTSVNSQVDRVSMHGLRQDLLIQQAKEIGIPLQIIDLPGNIPMNTYNDIMERETSNLRAAGFTHSAFGDIFLQDLKQYREQQLQKVNLQPVFPLWGMDTTQLMKDFLSAGFRAITVSVNAKLLDNSFCGREIDEQFLYDLPSGVDPAGENGEYHSFVFDGPNFSKPVYFQKGEITERSFVPPKEEKDNCFKEPENWDTRFYYCDLLPI